MPTPAQITAGVTKSVIVSGPGTSLAPLAAAGGPLLAPVLSLVGPVMAPFLAMLGPAMIGAMILGTLALPYILPAALITTGAIVKRYRRNRMYRNVTPEYLTQRIIRDMHTNSIQSFTTQQQGGEGLALYYSGPASRYGGDVVTSFFTNSGMILPSNPPISQGPGDPIPGETIEGRRECQPEQAGARPLASAAAGATVAAAGAAAGSAAGSAAGAATQEDPTLRLYSEDPTLMLRTQSTVGRTRFGPPVLRLSSTPVLRISSAGVPTTSFVIRSSRRQGTTIYNPIGQPENVNNVDMVDYTGTNAGLALGYVGSMSPDARLSLTNRVIILQNLYQGREGAFNPVINQTISNRNANLSLVLAGNQQDFFSDIIMSPAGVPIDATDPLPATVNWPSANYISSMFDATTPVMGMNTNIYDAAPLTTQDLESSVVPWKPVPLRHSLMMTQKFMNNVQKYPENPTGEALYEGDDAYLPPEDEIPLEYMSSGTPLDEEPIITNAQPKGELLFEGYEAESDEPDLQYRDDLVEDEWEDNIRPVTPPYVSLKLKRKIKNLPPTPILRGVSFVRKSKTQRPTKVRKNKALNILRHIKRIKQKTVFLKKYAALSSSWGADLQRVQKDTR
jgi:hypothetical protein